MHCSALLLLHHDAVQVIASFARHVVAPSVQSLPSVVDLIGDNLFDKSARCAKGFAGVCTFSRHNVPLVIGAVAAVRTHHWISKLRCSLRTAVYPLYMIQRDNGHSAKPSCEADSAWIYMQLLACNPGLVCCAVVHLLRCYHLIRQQASQTQTVKDSASLCFQLPWCLQHLLPSL